MTKYSTAIPATLILSLFSSVVHGQNYDERNGKLLKTSNDFQCFSDGLHVDPNDCSVFYRCMDWGESSENSIQSRFTAMKFRCAEGTVFDIETSNCVNIEETSRLECRQLADDDTISNIFERQAGDPDYGVVQPQSGYDRPPQPPSYNRPGPGEPDEQNPGDSGDGSENNNEPSSPSKSPPCEADGFFPIPNDCTHFYRCVSSGNGFLKYDFSCGPGTVWDPDNNACNHPWATSRPDCKSGTDGNQGSGPETIEISESPETAAQVAEPSSTTTSAPSTTRPTTQPTTRPATRPSQPSTSSSTKPSTNKPSSTTTKRSTTGSSSTTTTTEDPSNTSPSTQGPKDNSTTGENSCTSEGFFPDGKNCTKFYRCVDEGNGKFTKYEFECAEGTVWDVQETTCNYPYAVQNENNCNSTSSESQTATTAGQSSTSSSSQTSSRPTSTTSSSYNRPTSQRPSSSRPTSSTSSSYNRPTSQSTSSSNQQSSSSQTTSSSSQTSSSSSQTTSSSSQTSSSSSSSQTASSQSSSSTSSASSQSTSSSQQTSSQQSSSSTSGSSNQNNTTTNNAGTTTSSNNTNQTSKGDECTEEGFFPSSENCNKFYRCVSNEAGGFTKYNFNCGPGTVWDPENNVCNHPWAVKDEKCRSGGQGTTPMSESTTESSTTSSTENSTTPLNNTTPLSSTTPSSNKPTTGKPTSNKPTTGKPTSNKPTTSPTTQSPNKTTTGKPTTESSTQPSTSVTTTESSSKPTEMPDENNSTTTTDSTDSSTTPSNNSTATTTESASKNNTKPGNGIKCEKAGYYPNPKDCKKFYRCVDWDGDKGERFSVYHFDCPEGTIFDPALNICNHEESVYPPRDCSGSGSQTTDSPSTSKPDNTTTTESPTTTDSSNSTDSTTDNTSEPTTIQPTTDASTNTTEPITTEPSATTPQTTTPSESTTKKETETTTAVTSITTTPASTTPPEQTSTQPTTTEISTTPSSSETCPELGPDQYALVCPTGFRRHPKFCNLFYQCTVSKSMDTKIVILSCVNGTLYDEKKIQCLPPDETKKCEGSMAADSRTLKKSDDSVSPIVVKSDKAICPNEGLFSYKDDCRLFYKCKKDEQGKLTGFLYQCPEGFAFWSISKRCEKTEKVPCENSKTSPTSWKSSLAPVESRNIGF